MKSVASRENIITVSLSRTFYYPLASLHWRRQCEVVYRWRSSSSPTGGQTKRRVVPFNFVISQILTRCFSTSRLNEWVEMMPTFSRLLISRANFSFVVSIPRFSILALAWDKPHLTSVTWQSIILHKENSSIPFRVQVQVWEHPLTPSSSSPSLHNIWEERDKLYDTVVQEDLGYNRISARLCFDNAMMKTNFVSNGKIDQRSDTSSNATAAQRTQYLKIIAKHNILFKRKLFFFFLFFLSSYFSFLEKRPMATITLA